MDSYIIEAENLKKTIPTKKGTVTLLNGLHFQIQNQSITTIIGKSGAGKSTLLRCLNGLESYEGTLKVEGKPFPLPHTSERSKMLSKMGMIFQSYPLLNQKTILENVLLPFSLQKMPPNIEKAHVLLEEVGLKDKAKSYPFELSGGQKQRVAIARALALEPNLLLCDELTSALDPHTTFEILTLLKKIKASHHITIIIVTHDMSVVQEIADHVLVMENGQIIESASMPHLFIAPQHESTKELIESTYNQQLPPFLQAQITHNPSRESDILFKLTFFQKSSRKPLIAELSRKYQIDLNIVAGNLDHVHGETFGHLWVSCPALTQTDHLISFFNEHDVNIEECGYITW